MPTLRRTLILALVLVAAGSLIFTTGAAVIDGDADTFAEDRLAIQPADGPNGNYSYLNDDDEIAIDVSASNPNIQDPSFDGVNVDSTGTIDDVFTITYTADRYAHVWIEYDGDGEVTFVADGDSIEGEANNVTLAPNQTVTVGLELDTRGKAAGTQLGADEFSIEAKIAEPDAVGGTGASTQQTGDGGPTTTVTSPSADRREFVASDVERGEAVQFLAEGMEIAGDDVTLEGIDLEGVRNERVELDAEGSRDSFANGSALTAPTRPRPVGYLSLDYDFAPNAVDAMTIRFSADPAYLNETGTDPEDVTLYRQTEAGAWEEVPVEIVDEAVVEIMGLPEDRVHFRATTEEFSTFAVAERVPRYDVTEATVAPEAVDPGENVTVRTTLRNGGGAAGERTVTLTANGTPVANETVSLDPNETATVAFDATFGTAGAYDLAVDGTAVGTLLVGDPAGDDAGGSGDESNVGSDESATVTGTTEEPFGIDPADLAGPLALVVIAVATLALVRRMPR
ncbi:CARDB domain-containing protein [Halorubrum yunnanense]|uniref:CARDB domain-containing protein n=1 Tax=Halorubrum yunnanense TaxID=1526162 RepID=A0ABD5YD72_9EURY|nr:CARDB domain-containing protein [Halorubrum yunnanense]